jgi:hypothetical protein
MKHYFEFTKSDKSFTEHEVESDEFFTAMGMVAVAFSELEDSLSEVIISLLNPQPDIGRIVVAELSFRAKVNLFASLVRYMKGSRSFAVPNHLSFEEVLNDLCSNVFKAEELRNTIMHSSWKGLEEYNAQNVIRSKTTAKSKYGFRVTKEDIDPGYLMDIVDFMKSVAVDVIGLVFGTIEKTGGPSGTPQEF